VHTWSIRELVPERDADAVVALNREANPIVVTSRAAWLHRARTTPERAEQRLWGAELDGRIVGYAFGCRNFFSEGSTTAFGGVTVASSHRRRGIGTALYERVAEHAARLRATAVTLHFFESEAGVRFAQGLGYREARADSNSAVDPRAVQETPPPGVDLRAVADVDPHDVYAVDAATMRDVPLLEPADNIPYEEWESHILRHPLFTPDGSFLAYVDGEPAAVSLLLVDPDGGLATNMFTGTLRRFRGRGLAVAVKLASIRWAATHGITSLVTTNDERNAAMLAVNRRLGYGPVGRSVEWIREGMSSAPAPRAPAT
jgi:GNAT superfamily N-acetyltransferase